MEKRAFDAMAAATSAVYIKEAYKHYGPKSGPKRKDVLDGLCMKVHRGSIYGLLGASGCGKTTLLSCIVGRRKLNSGEIWVLGGTPGMEGSGVPGPRIGYMPQETALIPEFTVRGIVFYFGRIFGMTEKQIESRFRELSKLLDLPPDSRFVGSCSGGQQRRVSFAAAMIHDPELLILDEPTVGLDPVLRERIWEYLVEITNTKNIAVIITTHYIEECRQAHKIGLMREGQLLAEESPADLLNRFRADTLEEVFLELSRRQVAGTLPNQSSADYNQINSISATPVNSASVSSSVVSLEQGNTGSTDFLTNKLKKEKKKTSSITVNPDRLKALFLKNWLQFFRNYGGLAFAVLFPIVQMTVFFLAVGGDPRNLQLAIVNDENGTCDKFNLDNFVYFNNESECGFRQLSCKFLLGIEDPMINKVFYPDVETATQAVHNGKAIGVMYFSQNYTESTRDRAIEGREASDDSLDFGEVKVWLDMSNRQLGAVLQKKLLDKYIDFQKNIFEVCRYNPQLGEIPVAIKDPIYGHKDESYLMFIIPGFLVTVIFFLATLMTSNILISERLDGVWDRTLVAGATAMEIIIAHVVTQFVIISFQIFELLIICFGLFGADIVGNYRDIIGLMITQGISGMCYGFLISVGCANLTQANFIATGSFYPLIFISGAIWPAEAMPIVLRIIAYIMPFTICIDALRSIIIRGWDATFAIVLDAYGISVAWTAIFILFSFYILKNTM